MLKRRFDFPYGYTKVLCPGDSGGPQMTANRGILGVNSAYNAETGADIFANVPNSYSWLVYWRDRLQLN